MSVPSPSSVRPEAAAGPAITLARPAGQTMPVVFASPHSGRAYPAAFRHASMLDATTLRRSEDAFVDEIFAGVVAAGAPLLCACFPRAYMDVNREPYELDPQMFADPLPRFANTRSLRVAGGLGTIARVVSDGQEIYRRKLTFAEAEQRLESCYRPYHAALAGLVEETRARFGVAVLIDCHSMPSIGGPMDEDVGAPRPDIILGDRFGTACDGALTQMVSDILSGLGYRVSHNIPYAGGYTTEHYGRPAAGVHALQIEINRALYMDEKRVLRAKGLTRLAADMERFAMTLATRDLAAL